MASDDDVVDNEDLEDSEDLQESLIETDESDSVEEDSDDTDSDSDESFQLKWDLGKGRDFYLDSSDFTVFTFGGVPLSVWVDEVGWSEYPGEFNYYIATKLTEDKAKEFVKSAPDLGAGPKSVEQEDPNRLMWDD